MQIFFVSGKRIELWMVMENKTILVIILVNVPKITFHKFMYSSFSFTFERIPFIFCSEVLLTKEYFFAKTG